MSIRDEREYHERIYTVVSQVPVGKVCTYGDVATIVGDGCDARIVGHALGALGSRATRVPWQRIINRNGGISLSGHGQREILEAEGIGFDPKGQARMDLHHWEGPAEEWTRAHGFQPLPKRGAEPSSPQLSLF